MNFEELHGRRSGGGKCKAVLSHGFGTNQDAWSALRPWFDERYDVYSFDLPGCGRGGDKTYDFERYDSLYGYADGLIDLLDQTGIDDCLYVGHSMSAMIGAIASVGRPDLFSRIVMIGASPRYLNEPGYVGGFDATDLDALFDSMAAKYQAWAAGFAPLVVGVDDAHAVSEFSRGLFQMRPDIALHTSRTIFTSDVRNAARRVPVPVTLIQTANDVAVPREVGAWLAREMKDATLDIIDASGHLPHLTAPDAVMRILDKHLQGDAP